MRANASARPRWRARSRAFAPPSAALLVALAFAPQSARADLRDDAERLARAWTAAGQEVVRLPPVFLERGRARPIALPEIAGGNLDAAPCTSLALLTGRSADFVVRLEPAAPVRRRLAPTTLERSAAGAVLLQACGPARDVLTRISIELRAARATLESVLAVGPQLATPVGQALPERASGPVAPLVDTGLRAALAPLAQRSQQAVQRAKLGSPSDIRMSSFVADAEGSGREAVPLDEGCHRLDLIAESVPRRPLDVDAELRDAGTERVLARDRADAPDARLEFCSANAITADLLFAGAPGAVPMVLVDRRVALPAGLPVTWGARARAGFARALLRRTMPPVERPPIAEWLGVAGVTPFAFPVEPGSCYVAALATSRGEPRSVALSAAVDAGVVYDASSGRDDSAAIAFCAATSERVRFEVEIRGNAVAWVASVWQLGARALDEPR